MRQQKKEEKRKQVEGGRVREKKVDGRLVTKERKG